MNHIIQLLKEDNTSVLDKINIYIQTISIFIISLYKSNIINIKLYIRHISTDVIPRMKSFMVHLMPFVKAFIKYYLKKYYYKLTGKKYITLHTCKEYWNLCLQLHKIIYRYAEVQFFYKVMRRVVIPYLVIITFIIFNYFIHKMVYTYSPSSPGGVREGFDELYLYFCKVMEGAIDKEQIFYL